MDAPDISVQIFIADLDLRSRFRDIVLSLEGFDLLESEDLQSSDLLIMELGEDFESESEEIREILESGMVQEIFLTSADVNSELLLKAMRLGIKEFFPQPIKEEDVKKALRDFQKRRALPPPVSAPAKSGTIINIIGSKGGVGTTTVAVNLATALADMKESYSIALVDMNTLFGEIPLFLNIEPTYHWGEITKNIDRLDTTFLMRILARHSSGIHILPSPNYLNGQKPATPEVVGKLLGLMREIFDFVIVDGGQTLNENTMKVFEMSERVFLITLLNLPCLRNTQNIMKSLSNYGHRPKDRVDVLVNRYLKNSEISLEDAEKTLKLQIFCTLPNDFKTTLAAINQGKPLLEIAPKSDTSVSIRRLAEAVARPEMPPQSKKRWKLFGR